LKNKPTVRKRVLILSVLGTGTETYLCINGLIVNEPVPLGENKTLVPLAGEIPFNVVSKLLNNDIDFSVAVLCSGNLLSQLHITDENSEKLAIAAWNAQWDILLLSAIFNCSCNASLQCSDPIDVITEKSSLHITNYFMQGIFDKPYTLTSMDKDWITANFVKAQQLIWDEAFMTAVHSMATYRWNPHPRVQLSILWAGIESIFKINSELNFRISLYISKFLSNKDADEGKEIFREIKSLYKARSSAVHGDTIKGDTSSLVMRSASILNRLIRKCVENNGLPDIEDLIY